MRRGFWAIAVLAVLTGGIPSGCGSSQANPPSTANPPLAADSEAPKDEAERLFEQLRSGAFQVDAAMGAMERAMNRVRGIQADRPEIRDAQQVIADYLDSAGATAGEFLDTPDLEAVRADFAAADETRLKAIEEIDDARREVEEAVGYAETLAMNDTTALRSDFERIQSDIQEALDALESAIEALGGTPTPVEEDTGDAEE